METIQTNIKTRTEELVGLIAKGIECWQKAGEVVVKIIDEDGMSVEEIAASSDFLTEDIVFRFEQIGRKLLSPVLMIADYPAARHIIKLSYKEQEEMICGSVEVLLENGESLNISVQNLTQLQCRQVFDKKRIRTLPAQRAWMESERTKSASYPIHEIKYPYTIRSGRIFIPSACQLTKADLKRMLSDLS